MNAFPQTWPELIIASGIFGWVTVLSLVALLLVSIALHFMTRSFRWPLYLAALGLFPLWCGTVKAALGFFHALLEVSLSPVASAQDLYGSQAIALVPLILALLMGVPLLIANLLLALCRWQEISLSEVMRRGCHAVRGTSNHE